MQNSPETPRNPRKTSTSNHQCPHCDKVYERPDHLARHIDSHRNERVYQCPTCQRGFNRRDVLQRHQAVHEKHGDSNSSVRRQKGRAAQACEACASAKLSCDNERPCQRCQSKEIDCVPKTARASRRKHDRAQSATSHITACSPRANGGSYNGDGILLGQTPNSAYSDFSAPSDHIFYNGNGHGHDVQDAPLNPDPQMTIDRILSQDEDRNSYASINQFPAFFEQVMLPSFQAHDSFEGAQQPRVFDWMQDNDINLSENDIFGTEFIPDLDRIFDFTVPLLDYDEDHPSPLDDQESASRRVAAFQRSLWRWIPEKNQHGFSEEPRIPLRDSDNIPSTHQTRLNALKIPGNLSFQARDEIFKLVLRTAGSRLSVSAFPSPDYLDTLIKIGMGKRVETDAWLHLYTFYDPEYQQLRPELLTALVAAGCVCCGLPSISKTGVILQEITRVGLAQLVEEDNSVLRDLQYLQASMLWLDIGISCGYTRKMLIAESYLQPLCTALRRAAAFDRSTYSTITPYSFGDDEQSLQRAWYSWVRQESLKRLIYHLFGHDVEVTLSMSRPAIISYTELTLPLPADRDLWLAPTAIAWRDIWNSRYHLADTSELSLRDLLSDPSLLSHIPLGLDSAIVRSSLLHGLALQVWEFSQQTRLCGPRATTRLWLQSRQEDLYSILKTVREDTPDSIPVTLLMNSFVMMYLHIDIDSIQRFIGKMGDIEARRAYPSLREWGRTKDARIAIWHAGQVFRAARTVAPYQFRGFESLAIYHSSLVLWVYGLLQCAERKLEVHTPMSDIDATPTVVLDGTETQSVRAFLHRGVGRPGLTTGQSRESQGFCELNKPRSVMTVAKQVLDGNCPRPLPGDILPPMIQNLCSLIEDLGSLP